MGWAVLLDTCAAIWLVNGQPMSPVSLAAVEDAQRRNLGIYVSAISAWEIATLVSKNRLRMSLSPSAWFEALIAFPGMRLGELSPEILIASAFLPGSPPIDPADRIIAATAQAHALLVVTRDRELTAYAKSGHIELVPC